MRRGDEIMNPKQFLIIGGGILFLIGILGYVGILGPTVDKSIFHAFWWFDNSENVADTVLGIAGLFAAFTFSALWQKYLVILLGVIGIIFGIYSLVSTTPVLGANLENPADTILHLLVGSSALYAALFGEENKVTA